MSYVDEKVLTVDGSTTVKRYQLLAEIGSGSFSKCWKVRPVGTDKVYAMKMIPKKSLKSLEQEKVRIGLRSSSTKSKFIRHSRTPTSCSFSTRLKMSKTNTCSWSTAQMGYNHFAM